LAQLLLPSFQRLFCVIVRLVFRTMIQIVMSVFEQVLMHDFDCLQGVFAQRVAKFELDALAAPLRG
jgi:hypothetical protein